MSKKIAAIVTAFFPAALGSHGDLIVSKFANGFPADDGFHEPQVDLVSMYIDQPNWTDLGHKLARDHNIEIYGSIRAALTLTHQGRPGQDKNDPPLPVRRSERGAQKCQEYFFRTRKLSQDCDYSR